MHKLVPIPLAMNIPDVKAAVEKKWETRENTSMAADESPIQHIEVTAEAKDEGKPYTLRH